ARTPRKFETSWRISRAVSRSLSRRRRLSLKQLSADSCGVERRLIDRAVFSSRAQRGISPLHLPGRFLVATLLGMTGEDAALLGVAVTCCAPRNGNEEDMGES